jgi:hypothetical protein
MVPQIASVLGFGRRTAEASPSFWSGAYDSMVSDTVGEGGVWPGLARLSRSQPARPLVEDR